jgi:hypothetical protein
LCLGLKAMRRRMLTLLKKYKSGRRNCSSCVCQTVKENVYVFVKKGNVYVLSIL